MDPYWQTRPSDAAKEMILADWMAALENYDAEEVDFACKAYLSGPDCRVKPKPGDILRIMVRERGKLLAALPKPEPEVRQLPPVAERAEAAKRIMAEVMKDMGGEA